VGAGEQASTLRVHPDFEQGLRASKNVWVGRVKGTEQEKQSRPGNDLGWHAQSLQARARLRASQNAAAHETCMPRTGQATHQQDCILTLRACPPVTGKKMAPLKNPINGQIEKGLAARARGPETGTARKKAAAQVQVSSVASDAVCVWRRV